MSSLIILGNKNEFTFYNAIISAEEKSKEIFNGELIERIYVIHTPESFEIFFSKSDDESRLVTQLKKHGIATEQFIHRIIDTSSGDYTTFLNYIRDIIATLKDGNKPQNLMIDATNGTASTKSILSVVSYILDINNVFFIDSIAMFRDLGDVHNMYLEPFQVSKYYIQSVPNKTIDTLAYLNLTEVTRYKERIDGLSKTYKLFDEPLDDTVFFQSNLLSAVQLKLRNDKNNKDESIYRISSTAIASSIEDMIGSFLESKLKLDSHGKTLGKKIQMLQDALAGNAIPGFDFDFFEKFNSFILFLRNNTVHHYGSLSASERFKAALSIQMSLIFLDYYSNVVFDSFKSFNIEHSKKPHSKRTSPCKYYGLDGDNTGRKIEALLAKNASEEDIRYVSNSIAAAKNRVKEYIEQNSGSIIFAEGDDILFEGTFTRNQLNRMKQIYCEESHGVTCSISCGNTFREVFLAMKLAKAERNTIREVALKSDAI